MDQSIVKSLHPLEIKVLRKYSKNDLLTADTLVQELEYKVGQANQALSWLSAKGFVVEKGRTPKVVYEFTDFGRAQVKSGTVEEQILSALINNGPKTLPELAALLQLENKDIGSAFGLLSKEGLLAMGEGKRAEVKNSEPSPRMLLIKELMAKAAESGELEGNSLKDEEKKVLASISKKRGASGSPFRLVEGEVVSFEITSSGAEAKKILEKQGVTGEEIGALTPELLASGKWKNGSFRPYNVAIPPSRVLMGRRNPYSEYLISVKDKLVSLGFEEFDGPLVESEFWNGDALFMPQFHAARDIHDVYYVKTPTHAKSVEQPYLDQVAAAHADGGNTGSRGWGYQFDRDFTRRLILRSQGTVLSAKQLHKAKIPGKYFGIARCFRYDQVDATHGADFYQTEGIVLGNEVNLQTLLGLLKMFAEEVAGAEEVRYVPGYFPFTEPSIEVHIKHPVLGWFELGGSGIFRPEVTKPMGIDVPVLAWGLGIDRMALMHLGLNDLRELFSSDIESVRMRRKK
jgi:phenylalanyl-tRNA synthetase alpha chain